MKQINYFITLLLMLLVMSGVEMKAATAATASFDGTGVNVGKNLPFNYEFTTSGSNVTLTISDVDGTNVVGLDAIPNIYDWTNGSEQSRGKVLTYTWESVKDETTLKVRLNWAATDGIFRSDELSYQFTGGGGSATPDNLALNKTAIATSGTAAAGNNGSQGDRWESVHSDPQTWQVDLGSSQTFNAIVIYWEGAYGKTFTIEAGDNVDGDGYLTGGTTIASVTGQTLTGSFPYEQVIPVNSTTARYIKFNGIERGTVYGYSFYEFEVYNDASLAATSLTISGATSKQVGQTEQFTYTAINSSSQPVTPGIITWTSSNPSVGTISESGLFTPLSAGTTTISAVGGVVSNSVTVTVTYSAPTSVPAIKTVGTDGITAVRALYDQGTKQNGFDFAQWESATTNTTETIDGHTINLLGDFNWYGSNFASFDATKWDKLHIDIYPMSNMSTAGIQIITEGAIGKGLQLNVTPGQWNSLELDLQALATRGLNLTTFNQIMFAGGMTLVDNTAQSDDPVHAEGNQSFYVGNIYFYSTQSDVYSEPADVPGIITSFNDGTSTYSIASDQVTKIYTVDGNAAGFGFQVYNGTAMEAATIIGKQAEKFTNFNTAVGAFTEVNISDAEYLHVDVYPMEDVSLVVYHSQSNQIGQKYNITAGQWNSIDIPMSSFNKPAATNTFLLTQNMTADGKESHVGDIANVTLYLGNYYYFKTASVPDTEAPVMATATVSNIGTTTATLTVSATDNKAGNLTYNIYNGSVAAENLLTTATGTAGSDKVVELTGLTQGGTYNLVVTATDAANNTSASMAVAEFTTLDYIPTLTTLQVVMKGESTDAFNTSNTGNFERIIRVIALDQKGLDMPSRQVKLRVTDGNTGTNDISFVQEQPWTVVKDGTNGSTSINVNNHVGRVTVEAVDVQTGKTGYAFLTFYDARNTAATNEDQLISDPTQVASAKISGASTDIIKIAASGHGTNNYVSDGAHPAEFVVDWSSIQDNQQHYEYYDIDMIQVLYQQGKFPKDYTIAVSHDGGETYEDVYHYDGTQTMYIDPNNTNYRADAWNASRQLTQAVTHVRFRSNNNDAIAFDAFKVYGKLNSVDDNKAPYDLYAGVKVAASTDDANKTSTAQIWIECKDDETEESDYLYYTITSARGMQYTTKGHPCKGDKLNQVIFDFNNTLVPGSHYVFYITASDGRNKTDKKGSSADLMKIEFDTPALVSAPDVDGEVASKASTTATLNYWLPVATNTAVGADDDIVITVKRGTTVVADATYKKGQVDENHKVALSLERLTPSTTYTYTITATNTVNGLSSEKSLTFATEAGGSSLEVWFTDGGEHYTGWTGELEDIITTKGKRDVLGVTEIHIKGSLNNEDIMLLRRMAGGATYIGNNSVKQRVFIKADAAPYLYAWKGAEKLLGDFPGRQLTTKTNGGYYVYEFNTDGVSIVINNGKQEGSGNTNNQTKDIPLALGNNYFTYNGGNGCEDKTTKGYYGTLATMDLAQAEFYHDGGAYVTRWYANANTPTILNPIDGEFKSSPDISGYMFMECKNLLTVTVPSACEEIALNAFYGGTDDDGISLTTIKLNEGLKVIADYAFDKNENLGEVTLPSTLKQIGYNAFCDCHAMTLGNANGQLPNSITNIDNQAFANTSIAEVILPANAAYTTVKTNVFGWNSELTKVTIPANVKTLMDGSFRDSKKLAVIDDAAATITEIGDEAFMNDIALPSAEVNGLIAHLTTLNNGVFNGCKAVTEVNIPAGVTTLKNLTFANCTNINRVTVNSATAPSGYAVIDGQMISSKTPKPKENESDPDTYYTVSSDPFDGVNANHMTLTFAGAADGGYKSYREGTAKSNAFHRLLTKTLDEEKKSYDVAGQMHADVVLKRTMVEGWNTVALPFGVKDDSNRDRDYTAAGVYKAAFNGTDAADDKFMIAAYRGIDTTNPKDNVFKFLKYSSYTTDPLDEFEPLLIRMGQSNLSASKEYTFVDVDLNYDVEKGKLYRNGNADEEVPVTRWDTESSSFKPFIGSNYDHKWSQFANTTNDFAFTGTYSTKTTVDKGDNFNYTRDYFIKPGDYLIQSNLFYKVLDSKKYGLKGFRAWFQKQEQDVTGTARPAQLKFSVVELDGDTPTEIDSFDAVDNDVKPFDVYSIGGQLLRKQTKSLNGLPNGIYIVNGRKVAVGK